MDATGAFTHSGTISWDAPAGWERRRFNPAFALLIPCVHDGRVRKSLQDDYPTMGILLADEDLVELRRYVQRTSQ